MDAWLSLIILVALIGTVVLLLAADRCRRRPSATPRKISVLIPCFNDCGTIRATVESVFRSYPPEMVEVLAADDCSTDGSQEILDALATEFGIRVIRNKRNLGKAATLNGLTDMATHPTLLFLDADTCLNRDATGDMVRRLNAKRGIAAVSCPYQPANRGFLARMQSIEYSMMALVQGAYNVTSALAIWGGCFMIRREAFDAVGRYSLSAITEDVDLAHKLCRKGFRSEQSMIFVDSVVPDTLRGWVRQKIRWTAGGIQCLFRHPRVWLKNPLHVFLMTVYCVLSVMFLAGLLAQSQTWEGAWMIVDMLNNVLPWNEIAKAMVSIYASDLLATLLPALAFSLISVIYVVPLIKRLRDLILVLMVVPFSLAYFPLYAITSVLGFGYFGLASRRLARNDRAW